MEMNLLFLSALFVFVLATPDSSAQDEQKSKADDPFVYDYETLRIWGLTLAVVLFTLGILIILSRRCRCGKNKNTRMSRDEEVPGETPIVCKTPSEEN